MVGLVCAVHGMIELISLEVRLLVLISMVIRGQPTEVGTGGVSRSYAFTTAGLPSRRRILDAFNNTVQDYEYSYAPATGNMSWRRDNVLGYTEAFSYDALNRLLSAHQTMTSADSLMSYRYDDVYMTYASNGNVTFRSNDGILECFIDYNDSTDPYKATGNYAMGSIPDYVPKYGTIAVTSFDRPGGIAGNGASSPATTFTYDAGGDEDEDELRRGGVRHPHGQVLSGRGVRER